MHMRRIVSYLGLQDCLISVARSQLGISERELVARSAPLPFHSVNNGITGYRLFSQAKESTGFCAVKARGGCEKCPLPFHTVNNGITGYRLLAQTKEST